MFLPSTTRGTKPRHFKALDTLKQIIQKPKINSFRFTNVIHAKQLKYNIKPTTRLRYYPFASIVNSFSTGYVLRSKFQYWEVNFYAHAQWINEWTNGPCNIFEIKTKQNKTNHFEMIVKSLYGICNSKLQQIYGFIYYDFPGHPLLVSHSNAYRPREEHRKLGTVYNVD